MIDVLNKYLVLNKSINIPGIGTIFIDPVPAKTDFINKEIHRPDYTFRFDKYFDSPDKEFFSYLAFCNNIPDYEAIKLYSQFAQDIRSAIKLEETVLWKDVGYFKKNTAGETEFEPLENRQPLFSPVIAERVLRSNATHAILVGDQEKTSVQMSKLLNEEKIAPPVHKEKTWWLYAAILSVIALTAIILHFYNYDTLANQHPLTSQP